MKTNKHLLLLLYSLFRIFPDVTKAFLMAYSASMPWIEIRKFCSLKIVIKRFLATSLMLSIFLIMNSNLNAQVINEGFETWAQGVYGSQGNWLGIKVGSSGTNWTASPTSPHSGSQCACSWQNANAYLISLVKGFTSILVPYIFMTSLLYTIFSSRLIA